MTSLQRLPSWPEAMAEFIESRRRMPFAWGSNDCALFAADAWEIMTGIDFAAGLRGYKTEKGALRRMKKAGGMREIVLSTPLQEKPKTYAQRYDVVLVATGDWHTLGLNVGNGYWCAPGPDALVFRPASEIEAAFGI